MTIQEIKKTLQSLLIDDLDAALESARTALPENAAKSRQLLLLIAQKADLDKGVKRGILRQDDIDLRSNQIRSNFLDWMDTLSERDLTPNTDTIVAPASNAPKFVVVYAPEDEAYATRLSRFLQVLKITGKLRLYLVNEAKAGENPFERTQQEWSDADYMLALITVNLFNAPDWFEMVYQALGNGKVIPIRIERSDYEGTGLEKLSALPTGNKAVSDFANADEAYTNIVSGIKRLLPGGK